jgi:hypothetical protein
MGAKGLVKHLQWVQGVVVECVQEGNHLSSCKEPLCKIISGIHNSGETTPIPFKCG